jgi:hypothetical protein
MRAGALDLLFWMSLAIFLTGLALVVTRCRFGSSINEKLQNRRTEELRSEVFFSTRNH